MREAGNREGSARALAAPGKQRENCERTGSENCGNDETCTMLLSFLCFLFVVHGHCADALTHVAKQL